MSEQMAAEQDGGDDAARDEEVPEFRMSHLMDELADAYSEREMVQKVAPFERGGIKPRVQNRVTFTSANASSEDREDVETVLDARGFAWTLGSTTEDGTEYVVLGREIRDPRELRKGDRIHLNKRGGPFKVYRVMEQPSGPEVLQRSDPSVTVELTNTDTDTDWMVVHWKNDSEPWAYVRTKDKNAKGGFRYRKVESVERAGRIGPLRMFAPSHDHISEGYQDTLHERVKFADDNGWLGDAHPSDVARVLDLMAKPAAEVFSPEDADTVREVMNTTADAYERQGNAMAMEAPEDDDPEEMKALAADNQDWGQSLKSYAEAFNLANMDTVEDTGDTDLWVCEDCGQAFLNKYKYPTHRRDCPADHEQNDEHAESDK